MLLDPSCNKLLGNLVLLRAASVGQPRSVDDVNVENMFDGLTTLTSTNTYYCIVVACKFVKAGGVGPTLVVRTTSFVGVSRL